MNGEYFIHLGGNPNHRRQNGEAVVDLFAKVGQVAPGSYGLLYVHDDEHPQHMLSFQVFRLVRGTVTEHPDHLLSPVIPTLEDEGPS
ncbi:MAG TPA: Imm7 family immunity protein [Lentzea sp.]